MATAPVKNACSALAHELRSAGYAVLEPAAAHATLELDVAALEGLRSVSCLHSCSR